MNKLSAITPDSYVKLVRFDVTKEHQMTFASLTAQTDFFTNLQGLELQASTYQRKEGKVRFPVIIDDIENYNFISPGTFLANLVYSAHSDCIDSVICDGRFIMRGRVVEGEKEIIENAKKYINRLWTQE